MLFRHVLGLGALLLTASCATPSSPSASVSEAFSPVPTLQVSETLGVISTAPNEAFQLDELHGDKQPLDDEFELDNMPKPSSSPAVPVPPVPVDYGTKVAVDLWQWGAKAAVSYTLDEGVEEPYLFLLPEIEKRGWKASFFIYTRQPAPAKAWDDILLAYQQGHEVSNHTLTHPNMTQISDAQLVVEMEAGITDLKNLGIKRPMYSFAYPYEATDDRVWSVVKKYHRYARSGDGGIEVPPNPVPINDARKPNFGALTAKANTRNFTVAQWNSWIDATHASGGWFIEEWHGVEKDGRKGGWEPRTMDEFNAHFDHVETFGDALMVQPMGVVGNYIESRESAKIEVKQWSPEGVDITLSDDFDFTVPLTLRIDVPEAWDLSRIEVTQAGKPVVLKGIGPHQVRIAVIADATLPIRLRHL